MNIKIPNETLLNFFNYNFQIKETSDQNEIRINSIYSNDEKFHLYINIDKGMFNDFKSNNSGSVTRLISDFLNIPENQVFVEIIKKFSSRESNTIIHSTSEIVKEQAQIKIPDNTFWFSDVKTGIFRDKAYKYLKDRKIKEDYINEMGYCTAGEFEKRIIIPFWENKNIVYFIARDYTRKNELRYKNPIGASNRDFIYNYDKMEDCGTIVIAEGLMDILSLDNQIGFPILSAHLSKTQLIKLFEKLPKKIILVPDTDKTGKETLQRNIDLIYTYKPASIKTEILIYNIPDEYKDLNEMKIKTGKNYIDDNECEVVKKRQTFSIDKVFGL